VQVERRGLRKSVVGGEVEVRCSGGEVVEPREVRCPDDDDGRVAEANGAGAGATARQRLQTGGRRGEGQENSN
jgi:hypothetical protein